MTETRNAHGDNQPEGAYSTGQRGNICAVVISFRRTSFLPEILRSISSQSLSPIETVIVDNGSDPQTAKIAASFGARYIDAGDNLGPAGAMEVAMKYFLANFSDNDWLLRLDDDRPLTDDHMLEDLVTVAEDVLDQGVQVGGIGLAGAVWNRKRATLSHVPIVSGTVTQHVDYLTTNHFPLFRGAAIRTCGAMRSELFFGMEEVEFGLRLRRHGFALLLHSDRVALKRGGHDVKPPRSQHSFRIDSPTWRQYYSMRNHVVIAREYSGFVSAVVVTVVRGILMPLLSVIFSPRHAITLLGLRLRAIFDAWTGRMGRRIDPYEWDKKHGRISLLDEMPMT